MLDKILSTITDSSDYLAAISQFRGGKALTKKEVGKLLAVYAKYVPGGEDAAYAKGCLAVDLLSGRTEADRAYFAPLDLGDGNLDALFAAQGLLEQNKEVSKEEIQRIAALVQDETLDLYARVILARTALNVVGYSRNFVRIRAEITVLADFLTSCGAEVLDQYMELVAELRYKCRKAYDGEEL